MPVDPSIILGIKPVQLDNPLDMAQRAMTMQNMNYQNQMQQRQMGDDQAMRSAYQKNMAIDQDGNPTVDRKGLVADLSARNPMLAIEQGQKLQSQDLATKQAKIKEIQDTTDAIHANAMSMRDPDSYAAALENGKRLGLPGMDKLPTEYDPSFVQQLQMRTSSLKDQMEMHNKDREFAQKSDELSTKHEENSIKRDQLRMDKVDKYTKDMKNDLDADKGRAGNFGQISGKVEQAQRLQTLIHSYQNGDQLPPAQMEELALGLSNMLAPGGGGSRDQVAALVPHSAIGDTNKMLSYLGNQPRGAGQGGFVDQIAHTIDREAATANDQLNAIRANRVGAHSTLRQIAPDAFNRQLRSYGMDPANIDANGNYKVPAAPQDHPQDNQAMQWAKSNPNDPRAAAIMKLNGGGQ